MDKNCIDWFFLMLSILILLFLFYHQSSFPMDDSIRFNNFKPLNFIDFFIKENYLSEDKASESLFSKVEEEIKIALCLTSPGRWMTDTNAEDPPFYTVLGSIRYIYYKENRREKIEYCIKQLAKLYPDNKSKNYEYYVNYFLKKICYKEDQIIELPLFTAKNNKKQRCIIKKISSFEECCILLLLQLDQKNHEFINLEEYSSFLTKHLPSLLKINEYVQNS